MLRTPLVHLCGILLIAGCGSSTAMIPEAEPLAGAAVEDSINLPPYLNAYGSPVMQIFEDHGMREAQITRVLIFDFGAQGRCTVQSYLTPSVARQLAPRNANETVRDMRGPTSTDLLRGGARRRRAGMANNPTFLFGRHVALCSQRAPARSAFKALEVHARDGA